MNFGTDNQISDVYINTTYTTNDKKALSSAVKIHCRPYCRPVYNKSSVWINNTFELLIINKYNRYKNYKIDYCVDNWIKSSQILILIIAGTQRTRIARRVLFAYLTSHTGSFRTYGKEWNNEWANRTRSAVSSF